MDKFPNIPVPHFIKVLEYTTRKSVMNTEQGRSLSMHVCPFADMIYPWLVKCNSSEEHLTRVHSCAAVHVFVPLHCDNSPITCPRSCATWGAIVVKSNQQGLTHICVSASFIPCLFTSVLCEVPGHWIFTRLMCAHNCMHLKIPSGARNSLQLSNSPGDLSVTNFAGSPIIFTGSQKWVNLQWKRRID